MKTANDETGLWLFASSVALYLLLMAMLTTVYGTIAQDVFFAEVGLKVVTALASLSIAIQIAYGLLGRGGVILILMMIALPYTILSGCVVIAVIAYITLCISISIAYGGGRGLHLHRALCYVEKTVLYSIPTMFLLFALKDHWPLSIYVVVVTVFLLLMVELSRAIKISGTPSLGLPKILESAYFRTLRSIVLLVGSLEARARAMATSLVENCVRLANMFAKLEVCAGLLLQRVAEAFIALVQNATKFERRVEGVFYRIAGAVESLQHKTEHSLTLLLFLAGLLMLIAITFYVLLLV